MEKRSGDKLQQPSHLHVLTESLEVAAFVLDTKVSAVVGGVVMMMILEMAVMGVAVVVSMVAVA